MKPDTRNAYARRVDAVLTRLQQAIAAGDDLPGLDELAAVAHLSPFHFHRVWRALTGEPLGGTVARLRLARALQLLGDAEHQLPRRAGLLLGITRAMGEVGISLMLGGNIAGRTNTLSLEVFNAVSTGEFQRAALLCSILAIISLLLYLGIEWCQKRSF